MGLGIVPLMGIGAGLGLLRGGGIGGALKGAALGGAGGLIGNALQGSEAAIEGAKAIEGASQVGSSAIPTSAIIPGSIESSGMVAGASGNLVNPEYFVGAGTPFQTFTGGEGVLSNAFQNFSSNLPDYVTPDNVVGAANILSQSQPQQMPMPSSSASVSRGSQRQGNIDYGMAQPIKRRGIL